MATGSFCSDGDGTAAAAVGDLGALLWTLPVESGGETLVAAPPSCSLHCLLTPSFLSFSTEDRRSGTEVTLCRCSKSFSTTLATSCSASFLEACPSSVLPGS